MITWNGEYYPRPTFVNVRDDGSIGLEWCKPNGRVSIEFDNTKDCGEGESNMYAIFTYVKNPGAEPKELGQELHWIHTQADVVKALSLLGLKPE